MKIWGIEMGATCKVAYEKKGQWQCQKIDPALLMPPKQTLLVSSLAESDCLLKVVPSSTPLPTAKILPFWIEEELFLSAEAIITRILNHHSLLISTKEALLAHLAIFERYQLHSEIVSAVPIALWGFCKSHQLTDLTLLHLSERGTTLVILQRGELVSSYFIPTLPTDPTWQQQVNRALYRYRSLPFLTTGDPCPFSSTLTLEEKTREFALPIGLAWLSKKAGRQQVNFLEGPLLLEKVKPRLKRSLIGYAMLLFLITGGLLMTSLHLQNNLKKKIADQESQLLHQDPEFPYPLVSPLFSPLQIIASMSECAAGEEIILTSFSYQLMQFPLSCRPKESFTGKVEAKLTAPSPLAVDQFCQKFEQLKVAKQLKIQRQGQIFHLSFEVNRCP